MKITTNTATVERLTDGNRTVVKIDTLGMPKRVVINVYKMLGALYDEQVGYEIALSITRRLSDDYSPEIGATAGKVYKELLATKEPFMFNLSDDFSQFLITKDDCYVNSITGDYFKKEIGNE